jgi:hypothetical protein
LSSHPNPGNRYEAIQKEAAMLRIEGNPPSQAEFQNVKARLLEMPPAYTAEQIARAKASGSPLPGMGRSGGGPASRAQNVRVEPPSGRYQAIRVGNFLRMRVPSNWRQSGDNNSVTYAPEGAHYRGQSGQTGFTHGMQIGVIADETHDQQAGTDELIDSLLRSNPALQRRGRGYIRESFGGRPALSATLRNVSEVTRGPELVTVSTVPLRDGSLLYFIGVAPEEEAERYIPVFRQVKQSIQISDQQLATRE